MTNEQEVITTDKEAIALQEDWLDSEEYRNAKAVWMLSAPIDDGEEFANSKEFANARYLYRKRVQGDPV